MAEQHQSLVQQLAVQKVINVPGTAGRLLKQIRDLESVAPHFLQSGMIRHVDRPKPLNVVLSGIATMHKVVPALGGYLYVTGAVRHDLRIENSAIATQAQDSVSIIDDIDYVEQSKRLVLEEVRHAYELLCRVVSERERPDVILVGGPLVLNRSMVPVRNNSAYLHQFQDTCRIIADFWRDQRDLLFPWNPSGTVVAGIATERLGAIASISQQDLRTHEGRRHLLDSEDVQTQQLKGVAGDDSPIASIGERRFINAVLGQHARTAAFRMNVQTPRMEPNHLVDGEGVIGFHFRAGTGTEPRLVQLLGEAGWGPEALDRLAGILMAATVLRGHQAEPVALQLAQRDCLALAPFLQDFRMTVLRELKERNLEDEWLAGLDDDVTEIEAN